MKPWMKRTIVAAVVLVVLIIAIDLGYGRYRRSAIDHNLRMLQQAWLMYGDTHGGRTPGSVADLLADFQTTPEKALMHPLTGKSEAERYGMYNGEPRSGVRTLFSYYAANGWSVVREDGTIYWQPD